MRELKDTSIIIELVLIGFQVLIWVSLLILTIFGFEWVNLSALKQWSTEISVGLVGVAYMLGLIFDKAVSTLPYSWILGGSLTPSEDSPNLVAMRMDILTRNPEVYETLERRLNQHRLVRATVFNLALISTAALILFITRLGFSLRMFISFLVLSIVFLWLALFTGKRSAEKLVFELRHAHRATFSSSDASDLRDERPDSMEEKRRPRAI